MSSRSEENGRGDDRPDDDEILDLLITRADLDGLIRLTDEHCSARNWPGLERLASRARWAIGTGRQLWPAATHAEYRLALEAPAEWAASVVHDEGGHFSLGPLTEVIAQNHTWSEVVNHLDRSVATGIVAHERVLRGEDLRAEADSLIDPFSLPLIVEPWEPAYALPIYSADGFEADPPPVPASDRFVPLASAGGTAVVDATVEQAIRQLLEPWTASSNGRAEVAAVEGNAHDAVANLGVPVDRARLAPLTPAAAMAWLAWAGASGGAHGRRRGGAAGRFGAWWTAAALGDALDDWPLPGAELAEIIHDLEWFWWDAGEPAVGWQLRLAVHDPLDGLGWAINAHDAVID